MNKKLNLAADVNLVSNRLNGDTPGGLGLDLNLLSEELRKELLEQRVAQRNEHLELVNLRKEDLRLKQQGRLLLTGLGSLLVGLVVGSALTFVLLRQDLLAQSVLLPDHVRVESPRVGMVGVGNDVDAVAHASVDAVRFVERAFPVVAEVSRVVGASVGAGVVRDMVSTVAQVNAAVDSTHVSAIDHVVDVRAVQPVVADADVSHAHAVGTGEVTHVPVDGVQHFVARTSVVDPC